MKYVKAPLPELALIAVTRAMLGAGAALLFGSRMTERRRKAVGWTMFLAGTLSTLPLAFAVRKQISG
jgi:hypothetical protein